MVMTRLEEVPQGFWGGERDRVPTRRPPARARGVYCQQPRINPGPELTRKSQGDP